LEEEVFCTKYREKVLSGKKKSQVLCPESVEMKVMLRDNYVIQITRPK
jgi:hypothetical protein